MFTDSKMKSRPCRFGGLVKADKEKICHRELSRGLGMDQDPVLKEGRARSTRHVLGRLVVEVVDAEGVERWVAGFGPKPRVHDRVECPVAHGWGDTELTCRELSQRLQRLADGSTADVAVSICEMRRQAMIITSTRGQALILDKAEHPALNSHRGWVLISMNGQKVATDDDVDAILYGVLDDPNHPDDGVLSFQFRKSLCTGATACCTADGFVSIMVVLKPDVPNATVVVSAKHRTAGQLLLGFPKQPIVGTAQGGSRVVSVVAPSKQKVCEHCVRMYEQKMDIQMQLREWCQERYRPMSPVSASVAGSMMSDATTAVEVSVMIPCDVAYHDLQYLADRMVGAIAACPTFACDCRGVAIRRVRPNPNAARADTTTRDGTTSASLNISEEHTSSPSPASESRLGWTQADGSPKPLPYSHAKRSVWATKLGTLVKRGTMAHPVFDFIASFGVQVIQEDRDAMRDEVRASLAEVIRNASRGELWLDDDGVVVAESEGERSSVLDGAMRGTSVPKAKRLGVSEHDAIRTSIREEDVIRVKKVFDAVDYDGSGSLCLKELISFSASRPGTIPNSVFRYVGALGNDITFAQLLHCHFPKCGWGAVQGAVEMYLPRETAEAPPPLTPEMLKEIQDVFAHFDKAKTGFLTQADLARLLSDAELAEFACAGKGGLSLADFTALVSPFFAHDADRPGLHDVTTSRNQKVKDWTSIFPCGSAASYIACSYIDEAMGFSGPKTRERGAKGK